MDNIKLNADSSPLVVLDTISKAIDEYITTRSAYPTNGADLLSAVMTVPEAAEYLDYTPNYIANLCQQGSFQGAEKRGSIWLIPRESVENYRIRKKIKPI